MPGSILFELFSVVDKVCFIMFPLTKPYQNDTVLLIIYVVLKLVYPDCMVIPMPIRKVI